MSESGDRRMSQVHLFVAYDFSVFKWYSLPFILILFSDKKHKSIKQSFRAKSTVVDSIFSHTPYLGDVTGSLIFLS